MSEVKNKPRLHELPLGEREVKIDRKWGLWIAFILTVFVIISGVMITIVFMLRKGLW